LARPYRDIGFLPPLPPCLALFSYSAAGFLTVSSILKIVQAASTAAAKAFLLTTIGSHTNNS